MCVWTSLLPWQRLSSSAPFIDSLFPTSGLFLIQPDQPPKPTEEENRSFLLLFCFFLLLCFHPTQVHPTSRHPNPRFPFSHGVLLFITCTCYDHYIKKTTTTITIVIMSVRRVRGSFRGSLKRFGSAESSRKPVRHHTWIYKNGEWRIAYGQSSFPCHFLLHCFCHIYNPLLSHCMRYASMHEIHITSCCLSTPSFSILFNSSPSSRLECSSFLPNNVRILTFSQDGLEAEMRRVKRVEEGKRYSGG